MTAQLQRMHADSLFLPDEMIWNIVAYCTAGPRFVLSQTCKAFRQVLQPTLWNAILVHDIIVTTEGRRQIADYADLYDAIPLSRDKITSHDILAENLPALVASSVRTIVAMQSSHDDFIYNLAKVVNDCWNLRTLVVQQRTRLPENHFQQRWDMLESALRRKRWEQKTLPRCANIIVHLGANDKCELSHIVPNNAMSSLVIAFGKLCGFNDDSRRLLKDAAVTDTSDTAMPPTLLIIGGNSTAFKNLSSPPLLRHRLHLRDLHNGIEPLAIRHLLYKANRTRTLEQQRISFSDVPAGMKDETNCTFCYDDGEWTAARVKTNDPGRMQELLGISGYF